MQIAEGQKVEIIKSVSPQWKQLGALLDFDPEGQTLDLIEAQHKLDGPVILLPGDHEVLAKGEREVGNLGSSN